MVTSVKVTIIEQLQQNCVFMAQRPASVNWFEQEFFNVPKPPWNPQGTSWSPLNQKQSSDIVTMDYVLAWMASLFKVFILAVTARSRRDIQRFCWNV